MARLRSILLASLIAWPPSAVSAVAPTVTGTVLDAAGRPIAGAQVDLGSISPGYEAGVRFLDGAPEEAPGATTRTGGDGRFVLDVPESGLYRLAVRSAGKVAAELAPLVLVEETELEPGELMADGGLSVRVLDEAGHGMPG